MEDLRNMDSNTPFLLGIKVETYVTPGEM